MLLHAGFGRVANEENSQELTGHSPETEYTGCLLVAT